MPEQGETTEPNCMTVGVVDFGMGHGPVPVRCTKTGKHDRCMCVVVLHDGPVGDVFEAVDETAPVANNDWATDQTGLPELEIEGEVFDFPEPKNGSEA